MRIQSNNQTSQPERKAILLTNNWRIKYIDDTVNAIERALEQMPEDRRELVRLKYWRKDSTNVTVAQELNISLPTFHAWRKVCLQSVARHLGFLEEVNTKRRRTGT